MNETVLIIGGGQAAASAAIRLRKNEYTGSISIVGDEPVTPYQRPPLSKKYLSGEMEAEKLLIRPDEWYEENGVEVISGIACTAINRESATVTLADQRELGYDHLVLCTGSTPINLPGSAGGNLDGVHTMRSMADADAMAHEFQAGRSVLIVGGGYIGLEAAAVAASKGLKVTVVELADRILKRVASQQTSDWFRALHAGHGVSILEGVGLEQLNGSDNRVTAAVLSDGRNIDVDFVIVGIGIVPNTDLAESAGLTVDNGIVVDECGCSSAPSIYAAGDCASFTYKGQQTRLESVQNAVDQAEVVADTICGNQRAYLPLPRFWSDQYDAKLQIIGLARDYDEVVTRPGRKPGSLSAWYFQNGFLIAVDAMGDPISYVMATKALDKGVPLTAQQVGDPDFDIGGAIKAAG